MKRQLFDLTEFQAEYPLSQELPYWDFIEAKEGSEECVVLADGTLVKGLKLTGVDIETMDVDEVNRFTMQLRSVLNSLPDSLELQFLIDMNSDYRTLVEKHENLGRNNDSKSKPIVSWIADGRAKALRFEMSNEYLRKPNLYLFAYLRVKSTSGGLSSFFEKPKQFQKVRKEEHEKRVHELGQIIGSVSGSLSATGIQCRSLGAREIEGLVYGSLNPTHSKSSEAPQLNSEHRTQEFTPDEIKEVSTLTLPSPREQLSCSDVIQGIESFFLDGQYHRVLTLKTLPEFTHAALISRLTLLPFPFLLSLQLRVPEQSKELSSLQAKRRMAHSMTVGYQGRASDLESEAKLSSTEELLRELINTGQKIFYFQLAILLKGPNRDTLDQYTKTVLSRFREMNGAEGMAETVAGFKVFKTLLPAGNLISVRNKRVKTDNLADFLPVYQPWEGDGTPVCLFRSRLGGLVAYDPFDATLPNYNTLVTGSSGSGKSFMNNCILFQYLTQNPIVYVIDIGGSYRKLCEAMDGQYIEIAPTQADRSQGINPFLIPKDSKEPSPQKIKFLIALLETILTDEDGDKLRKLDKSLLEEALLETYARVMPHRMPQLSDFAETLTSSKGDHAQLFRDFAKMLYPWTGNRPYGRLLDTQSAFDLGSDLVVFDLKGLSSYPDLQSVMILIITDFILGKVDLSPERRKRILMDECWDLLKSRGASSFMEYCARTLRKSGSGITFITQGLEEIERSPIGPAILNNTATKFILMQRGDLDPIQKILKLNAQEMALIASLRQEKGSYSEAFLMANERRSVIRIVPTPLEYWLATSDASDLALINNTQERMPEQPLPMVMFWLAKHFPRGSNGATQIPESIWQKGA